MPASWQLWPKSATKTSPGKTSNHHHEIWSLEKKISLRCFITIRSLPRLPTLPPKSLPSLSLGTGDVPLICMADLVLLTSLLSFIAGPFNSESFRRGELMPDMMLVKGRHGYLGSIILYKLFYYFFQSCILTLRSLSYNQVTEQNPGK